MRAYENQNEDLLQELIPASGENLACMKSGILSGIQVRHRKYGLPGKSTKSPVVNIYWYYFLILSLSEKKKLESFCAHFNLLPLMLD